MLYWKAALIRMGPRSDFQGLKVGFELAELCTLRSFRRGFIPVHTWRDGMTSVTFLSV